MNKMCFAMALHFHQPVGNFKEVFERVYQRCYRPFLEYLPYYPDIKLTIHISGSLLDYFKEIHPEIIELIKDLVSKGQVEIMGGSYYEPIMTAISEKDMKGQMQLMSKSIKEEFGATPKGAWIPERVWHPDLVSSLSKAHARYCILDDTHFILSGLKKEDTYGYFKTGDRLQNIAVFASDKMLRYTIPFKDPGKTLEYFRKVALKNKDPLLVYADDVEKFGEWPGTYDWVYTRGWLRNFLELLTRNKDWIKTVKLSEYMKMRKGQRSVDIQEASYEEMMEWAGGPWLNFTKKYPETGHMYNKMRHVSAKVEEFARQYKNYKDDVYWSKVELYRGQCNCGYWHGVFGGLYMYHLRSAIYNHLIAAENIMDKVIYKGKKYKTGVEEVDFNNDGKKEYIVKNDKLAVYLDPNRGGAIKELDYRPICANLVNTLGRTKEVYHKNVKKVEPSLVEKLHYDRFPRYSMRSYLVDRDLKKEEFMKASFKDHGNFANGKYEAREKSGGLSMTRAFSVSGAEIELTKDLTVRGGTIKMEFRLKNLSMKRPDILFGAEFNLTMPFLNSDRYRYSSKEEILGTLNTSGQIDNVERFGIIDSGRELETGLTFTKKAKEVWYFPVETVSQSQISYGLNYQCSCIFALWKPVFNKEGIFEVKIDWCVGQSCR